MAKIIDLTEQVFGEWTVLKYVGNKKWYCKCSCGNEKEVYGTALRNGTSTSCGHDQYKLNDLSNKQFGQWTVLSYAGNKMWNCRCSCGVEKLVNGNSLKNGESTSCGCKTFIDLTGQVFGEWTVISYVGNNYWNCKCSCGNEKQVYGPSLRNKQSTSCGHRNARFIDLTGQTFGQLTVLSYAGNQYWTCKCLCGNIKNIDGQRLREGKAVSCGHKTQFKDLTGQTFGTWTALKYLGKRKWQCRCSCGKEQVITSRTLRKSKSTVCKHIKQDIKSKIKKTTLIDLTGQTFGEWTVLSYAGNSKWNCECSCGEVRKVNGYSLRNNISTSCGHNKLSDLTGQTFGEWTVLEYKNNGAWLCKCSCGIEREVNGSRLRRGYSRSCGHKSINYVGQTFGNYLVLAKSDANHWLCQCTCGNIKIIHTSNLLHITDSCELCRYSVRQQWQAEVLKSEEKFNSILCNICITLGMRLQIKDIANIFNITISYLYSLLKKYNSWGYVDLPNNASIAEQDLYDYISSYVDGAVQHDRSVLNMYELDIYLPNHKLAIEYNGSYWHSVLHKSKTYHQEKTLQCSKKNVELIHIFEHEWLNLRQKQIILNILDNKLNINQKTIYARNTEIREVNNEDLKIFLNTYHLQGNTPCEIALGLYYNNELIQVMTFGKPRFNREYDTELLRLCSKAGYKIIGGASKLFKHYIKLNSTKSIISYCDLSKFNGKVYEQIGMQFDYVTQPNYVYVSLINLSTLSRYQCTKQKLVEQGWGTEEQTEEEIMRDRNYVKIYNCGNARYIYKPNKI